MKRNLKKLIAMGLTAIMAVSVMSVSAFAKAPDRDMSSNATSETITYADGSTITVHANEGFTIEVEDNDDYIAPRTSVWTTSMGPNHSSSFPVLTLDGTEIYRDTFDTARSDVLFSQRDYKPTSSSITAAVRTNSAQTIDVDIIQYNSRTGANTTVGYVTFENYQGIKNLRARGLSSSYQYYFRVMQTGGNSGSGYVEVS